MKPLSSSPSMMPFFSSMPNQRLALSRLKGGSVIDRPSASIIPHIPTRVAAKVMVGFV